ncbi:MAG TPA: hypothetical protein VNH11_03615 [Pirellulales bacterium]|nr:hypothetical protein [Pirellulales bacterium]
MAETISSRTPEGEPNVCPVCEAVIAIEPSSPFGDAPCPRCGTLLWFVNTEHGLRLLDAELVEQVRQRLTERFGESVFEIGLTDSLDIVELVMELEEEIDHEVLRRDPDMLGEIIEWLLRQSREKDD